MVTRQQLYAEIETLSDESLEVVYRLLKNLKQLPIKDQSSLSFAQSTTNIWDWLKKPTTGQQTKESIDNHLDMQRNDWY